MSENLTETSQIKTLNRWLIALGTFMVVWTIGIFLYVHKQTEEIKNNPPIIMVDAATGKITNSAYSNLFPPQFVSTNSAGAAPIYEQKGSYDVKDLVIVNYFFVEGIVVDKQGNNYTVMYKDHNRVLQKVTVPKEFLLSPTADVKLNPAVLLAP